MIELQLLLNLNSRRPPLVVEESRVMFRNSSRWSAASPASHSGPWKLPVTSSIFPAAALIAHAGRPSGARQRPSSDGCDCRAADAEPENLHGETKKPNESREVVQVFRRTICVCVGWG